MEREELGLQIWLVLVGLGFWAFARHRKIPRHPSFVLGAVGCIGFALVRHLSLQIPVGGTRTLLLALQFLLCLLSLAAMTDVLRIALSLRQRRFYEESSRKLAPTSGTSD